MAKRGRKSVWNTHIEPYLKEIETWKSVGYTDVSICECLGISHDTFYRYAKEKKELSDALKNSKPKTTSLVLNSLLKKALGYEVEEVKEESGKDGEIFKRTVTKKHISGDTGAAIFMICNLDPEHFKQKQTIDQNIKEVPNINLILESPEEEE